MTKPSRVVAGVPPKSLVMSVQIANALVTGAPLGEDALRLAMAHYSELERVLSVSGPRFSNARADAVNLHNMAVRRLRETSLDKIARERRHAEALDGLVELGV